MELATTYPTYHIFPTKYICQEYAHMLLKAAG
uniref:Uncharacterized protein n=1 Tax=Arundo donax TaxID=35708 RepID=A0A0A8XSX2_ARUDO